MSNPMRAGWFAVLLLAALALSMFFVAVTSHATGLTLAERIAAVVPSLASRRDEPVDARELGEAVAAVTSDRQWAALIMTIGVAESALSSRIARNECKPHECDAGRASGLYQQHKNALNADTWGSTDVRSQTRQAARSLKSAFYQCNGHKSPRADWVPRTISAYSGRSCDAVWPGLKTRMATFERVRRAL